MSARRGSLRMVSVAFALALLPAVRSDATAEPAFTRPVQATLHDEDPGRLYSAPSLAVSPSNPKVIVASFVEMRTNECGLLRSTDAGRTWAETKTRPSHHSYPYCFVPNGENAQTPVKFGRNGTLYYALGGWDTPDEGRANGGASVLLARSDDLGDTWDTVVVRDARVSRGDDEESNRPVMGLAVDRATGSQDVVYVTWRLNQPVPLPPNSRPRLPMVAVSRDGGRTFDEAVNLSAGVFDSPAVRAEEYKTAAAPPPAEQDKASNFGALMAFATVDDKGGVYIAWTTLYGNLSAANTPANSLWLSVSRDQGRTFTTNRINGLDTGRPTLHTVRMEWSPAGGPSGTLHLVTTAVPVTRGGDALYARSTDGGRTWTSRLMNDDNPKDFNFQWVPNVSVAPNGRVDVAWWDDREDRGRIANDIFYSYSNDNGLTWSRNLVVTDRSVDRSVGVWSNNFNLDAPPGMVSTDAFTLFGWDDTRRTDTSVPSNAELGGGLQDVFVSAAQFDAVGSSGVSTTEIALGAAIGLTVAGLLFGVLAAAFRRTGTPPPAGVATRSDSPAHVG
jgi:hypothetical protein